MSFCEDSFEQHACAVSARMAEKLAAAKAYLGDSYVLHPHYKFTPRHSCDPVVYEPVRRFYLAAIHVNALRARQFNPASRDFRPDIY